MNEFEWRRQMRELHQPVAPQRDLWPQIEAALDGATPPGRRPASTTAARGSNRPIWLLAASFAGLTLLAVGLVLQQNRSAPAGHPLASTTASARPWKPADPRLAGAAIDLDAAQLELRQAIEQSPDSIALRRLLDRTEQQQARLRHLDQAG